MSEPELKTEQFDNFIVYTFGEKYQFHYFELKDEDSFYESFFDYFFSEPKLLKYCQKEFNLSAELGRREYVTLFKHLKIYIDSENIEIPIDELNEKLLPIFREERLLVQKGETTLVRLDKMGKIGEYLFFCILSQYFHFDCIIPKVHLTTDYNMSVYGIDALFIDKRSSMLLFGESKLTCNLDNGIDLIKESLSGYEKQIKDEYNLILSGEILKNYKNEFTEKYGDVSEMCFSFDEFVQAARIENIGIPIFIAHGTEVDVKLIIEKLKKIPQERICNLNCFYYLISLPVCNKDKMIATFTQKIKEKIEWYQTHGS